MQARLISFLQDDLEIPADWIAIARRKGEPDPSRLPIILWQYGLMSLEQLNQVFDWMETVG